jgi:phosphatidylglycerophosphatase A
MGTKRKLLLLFVTCGLIGYLPFAPGTYASALGCFFLYLVPLASPVTSLIIISVIVTLALASINSLTFEVDDPGYVVIDEFAGMCVTMAMHAATITNLIAGFVLFRFFDIVKPYPIGRAEHLRKGYGIMADDIVAGIFANLCLSFFFFVRGKLT